MPEDRTLDENYQYAGGNPEATTRAKDRRRVELAGPCPCNAYACLPHLLTGDFPEGCPFAAEVQAEFAQLTPEEKAAIPDPFAPVKPVIARLGPVSPLRWLGGKHLISPGIIKLMPAHTCYVEPFCGAAHVFFRKSRSPIEVINDANEELVNFYSVLQNRPESLYSKFDWLIYSRHEFQRLRNLDPAQFSEEDRAWRFLYLNRASYGGKGGGGKQQRATFGTNAVDTTTNEKPFFNLPRRLESAHDRLRRVVVENLDFEKCMRIYDRPATFFYLDPPYFDCEGDYGKGIFTPADHARLAEACAKLDGKFLLSINDCPKAREIYGGFQILHQHNVSYNINVGKVQRKPELLIGNYRPEA